VRPELLLTTRAAWRAWLKKHHRTAAEIWVIYPKKHTGRREVTYADAVEEALCFGWIDGVVHPVDDEHYAQRFTPRKNFSNWSQINLERFRRMEAAGQMTAAGRAVKPAKVAPPAARHATDAPVPEIFQTALDAAPAKARAFWATLAPGYRRDYIRWVIEARQNETRQRRLKEAMRFLAAGVKRIDDRQERRARTG
jgi:uncharacterized protein YdeI (YjbR/CyaY-like superfamily)